MKGASFRSANIKKSKKRAQTSFQHLEGVFFDDSSEPVAAVGFDYDAVDKGLNGDAPPTARADSDENETASDASLDALRYGLLVVIEDGHADGARTRAVALAKLLGLYANDKNAADAAGVDCSNIRRAVDRMKKNIVAALDFKSKVVSPP